MADLNAYEWKQIKCDIMAANIVLQGLQNDIYALMNHRKTANSIWNIVKELMDGIKLTKQERETKLADEFDKFTLEKEETIQSYYLRFAKPMNDIIINRIEMTKLQINTKFLNMEKNQDDTNEIRAERAVITHDPLALVDGRVIVQSVPARQSYASNNGKAKATRTGVIKNVGD
ncbi:hypothetical protein Tco_1291778 [Tanacetum coccineum]